MREAGAAGAALAQQGLDHVERPVADPAGGEHEVGIRGGAGEGVPQAGMVVTAVQRRQGLGAVGPQRGGEHGAVGLAHAARRLSLIGELVPGDHHAHSVSAVYRQGRHPERAGEAHQPRPHPVPGRGEQLLAGDLLPGHPHVPLRGRQLHEGEGHRGRHRPEGIGVARLDLDDGVRPTGHGGTGHDPGRGPGREGRDLARAGGQLGAHRQRGPAGSDQVGAAHREAVHRGDRHGRHRLGAAHRGGELAAAGLLGGHLVDERREDDLAQQQVPPLLGIRADRGHGPPGRQSGGTRSVGLLPMIPHGRDVGAGCIIGTCERSVSTASAAPMS